MKTTLTLILLTGSFSMSAKGDAISVVFDSLQLTRSPGGTLTFSGSIMNTGGSTEYINGVGLNLAGFAPTSYDDTDFLFNAPVSLGPSADSGSFDFFTVNIPTGFTPGVYVGTLNVQGGTGPNDDVLLGTGYFSVNVQAPGSAIPEPRSVALLVLGGLGVMITGRGRRIARS